MIGFLGLCFDPVKMSKGLRQPRLAWAVFDPRSQRGGGLAIPATSSICNTHYESFNRPSKLAKVPRHLKTHSVLERIWCSEHYVVL